MGRAAFPLRDLARRRRRLAASQAVREVVLMAHFARADEPGSNATKLQLEAFDTACAGLHAPRCMSNSAGILQWPDARRNRGGTGIMLSGVAACLRA